MNIVQSGINIFIRAFFLPVVCNAFFLGFLQPDIYQISRHFNEYYDNQIS